MTNSKAAIEKCRTYSMIKQIGGGLLALSMLPSLFTSIAYGYFSIQSFIWMAAGIAFAVEGMMEARLISTFKDYVSILPNVPNGYIPDIAASVGEPEAKVKKNLTRMIKKNFFANASIDTRTNCLVLANRRNVVSMDETMQPDAYAAPAQESVMVTVKCKSCGGINVVERGKVGECEYCGSAITAD